MRTYIGIVPYPYGAIPDIAPMYPFALFAIRQLMTREDVTQILFVILSSISVHAIETDLSMYLLTNSAVYI